MATQLTTTYRGNFQTEIIHGPTGDTVLTDLPPDNGGQGRKISPTDLIAASLSSCILTIMAKTAEGEGIPFEGSSIEIEKHMKENPRMIEKLKMKIKLPADISEKQEKKLKACVENCPVHRSLHPDIVIEAEYL